MTPDLLIAGSVKHRIPFGWPQKRTVLTPCARHALYLGCRALGLGKGDGVLVPAFNCNTIVEPLKKAGLRLQYVSVLRNGQVDWNHAAETVDRHTRALLWHHFLGNPEGIERAVNFARNNKLVLIEDCAHALFSKVKNRNVGTFGDIALFSIRKTIPVTHAAALVVNRPDIQIPVMKTIKKADADYSAHLSQAREYHYNNYFQTLTPNRQIERVSFMEHIKKGSRFHRDSGLFYEIDDYSKTVMANVDPHRVRKIRYRIYQRYHSRLKDIAFFNRLPMGSCPLAFPIIVNRGRDAFKVRLEKAGIEPARYWPGPMLPPGVYGRFKEASWLADHLLTLPCHQSMTFADVDYVCDRVCALLLK